MLPQGDFCCPYVFIFLVSHGGSAVGSVRRTRDGLTSDALQLQVHAPSYSRHMTVNPGGVK